ncbi:hypothetical protein EVAR_17306_1 [Eumeta japonica]|uniref:Uncharacterized protein n=1 Tax=Eumeta variegata TaxID=151549 RepID=A0A4C1TT59_EUMVA|nr:hypothetical protein EVAR_17306_1 [Eumeta japonica]
MSNAETTRTNSDAQTIDSVINSEYEVLIEIFGDKNQTSTKNTTTETPQEFVLMSQTEAKNDSTNNKVLQIVEVLFQKNQSISETSSNNDNVDFKITDDDETSTESTEHSSIEQELSQPTTSNEGAALSGGRNDHNTISAKTFQHIKSMIPEGNIEASKNSINDMDSKTAQRPVPKQHMRVDIQKLPPITCDPHIVSQKGECVPRSDIINNIATKYATLDKSSFSIPCPPGTGRAADNTCQSRA